MGPLARSPQPEPSRPLCPPHTSWATCAGPGALGSETFQNADGIPPHDALVLAGPVSPYDHPGGGGMATSCGRGIGAGDEAASLSGVAAVTAEQDAGSVLETPASALLWAPEDGAVVVVVGDHVQGLWLPAAQMGGVQVRGERLQVPRAQADLPGWVSPGVGHFPRRARVLREMSRSPRPASLFPFKKRHVGILSGLLTAQTTVGKRTRQREGARCPGGGDRRRCRAGVRPPDAEDPHSRASIC